MATDFTQIFPFTCIVYYFFSFCTQIAMYR